MLGGSEHSEVAHESSAERVSHVALRLLALLLFAVLVTSISLSVPRANHDVGMYLEAASLLLDGARPYVDFIDLNPPMIIYMSALPVAVGRILGMDIVRAFSLAVCLLSGWSAWGVYRSTSRHAEASARFSGELLAAGLVALTAFLWRIGDYGQREHLIVLLLTPYLVARASTDGALLTGGAFLRGVAAGLAICLKPPYAGVLVATEVFLLLARRRFDHLRSAEIGGVLTAGVLYLLHFAALPADVRLAFFGRWLPFVSAGYGVFETTDALWTPDLTVTSAVCVGALLLRLRWRGRTADLAACSALATLVSIAIYLMQRKGWFYHQIPLIAFRTMTVACVLAGAAEALRPRLVLGWAAVAALAWSLAVFTLDGGQSPAPLLAGEHHIPFRGFVQKYTRPGEHVLVLTTSVTPAFPVLLEEGRLPATRYLWFFPVPMFHSAHAAEPGPDARDGGESEAAADERRFLAEVKEDIERTPPALVIAPQRLGCQGCPVDFDLQRYFRDAGVLDAVGSYRWVGETAGFDILAPKDGAVP